MGVQDLSFRLSVHYTGRGEGFGKLSFDCIATGNLRITK